MSAIEILEDDFKDALSQIDFEKPYDPYSKEFMKPLFIGMLITAIKMTEDDLMEELEGAKKYWKMFEKTSDVSYKEMAHDELRHAGILIKKHLLKADDAEKIHLDGLEKERQELLKLIKAEV